MKTPTLEALQNAGWHLDIKEGKFQLPAPLQQRYPRLPQSLIDFLSGLQLCRNTGDTAWFLCKEDYEGTTESAFRWNEFELMELEWASQDNDTEWQATVKEFWDKHFPFLLSVKTGYAFFAVSLKEHNFGAVVHGYEPEFPDVSEQSPSFEEFLDCLVKAVQEPETEGLIQTVI
jgi:hypothetical protein